MLNFDSQRNKCITCRSSGAYIKIADRQEESSDKQQTTSLTAVSKHTTDLNTLSPLIHFTHCQTATMTLRIAHVCCIAIVALQLSTANSIPIRARSAESGLEPVDITTALNQLTGGFRAVRRVLVSELDSILA